MQQSEASAFNTVVHWHKLGEMGNECTSHDSIVLAVFMPKVIELDGDLTKFFFGWFDKVFFWHAVFYYSVWVWLWRLYNVASGGGVIVTITVAATTGWWRGIVGNAFWLKRGYSTPGPVSTAMGDCLRAGKPSRCKACQLGRLSLLPSMGR